MMVPVVRVFGRGQDQPRLIDFFPGPVRGIRYGHPDLLIGRMRGSRGIIISNVKQYIFVVHPENRWIMSAVTVPCIQPRSGNSHIGKSKGSFGPIAHIMGTFTIRRSEEHTSELKSLMRISYTVLRLKKK